MIDNARGPNYFDDGRRYSAGAQLIREVRKGLVWEVFMVTLNVPARRLGCRVIRLQLYALR